MRIKTVHLTVSGVALALLFTPGSLSAARPDFLRTEGCENPVGVDVASPRFSWRLPPDFGRQSAYELEIDGVARGKVRSSQSFGVTSPGLALQTSQRVRWRVRAWDGDGRPSDWSSAAEFTAGVIGDWQAEWIGPAVCTRPDEDLSGAQWITAPAGTNGVLTLTRTFRLPKLDGRAFVDMVHLGVAQHEIDVNGRRFHKWHGQVHDWRQPAFRDLAPYLQPGENRIVVRVFADPGPERELRYDRMRCHAPEGVRAFLTRIRLPDGTVIASDRSWQSPEGPVSELGELRDTAYGRDVVLRTETAAPAFAKRFNVDGQVASAVLHVTGVGLYEARLNGGKIGDKVLDPSPTAYDRRVLYSTYRLENALRPGTNELQIVLGHGWYDTRTLAAWDFETAPWRDFPRAIARLDLTYADGRTERLVTDGSWRQVRSPVAYDDIYEGEVVDVGGNLASGLPAAGLPACVCKGPSGALVAESQPGAKVMRTIPPSAIRSLGDGAYLFEFPENLSGWMRLTLRGQRKGDVVSLRYDERPWPEARSIDEHFRATASHRVCPVDAAFQTDRYICTGEAGERYEPRFTYKGFRYVLVRGLASAPQAGDAVACDIHTAFPTVGTFSCSDETFCRLMRMAERAYACNFAVGMPTDCPHREKNGWTGDASLASEMAQYVFENTPGYEKWLRDICDAQLPDGNLPGIVPTAGWGYNWGNGPAWDSALPVIAWNLWIYRGDRRVLDEVHPALVRYLDHTTGRTDGDGLIGYGLGDWVPVCESHMPSTTFASSCYYLQALRIAAEIAAVRGEPAEQRRFDALAERTRKAIVGKFGRGSGIYDNGGQTAQAMALAFGLVPPDERPAAERGLVRAVERTDCHVDFGVLGSKHVFRALSRMGRDDLAWRMLTNPTSPSMTDWIRKGGTTLWEDWKNGNSRNHIMFGDFAGWAYQYLAGIRMRESPRSTSAVTCPTAPAFKEAVIEPKFLAALDWLSAATETPYGRIAVSWRRSGGTIELTVTVPAGVTAEIRLPGRSPSKQGPGTETYVLSAARERTCFDSRKEK